MNKGITLTEGVIDPFSQHGFKSAFTLAEVLITLGIIGIVAALTMPALISNYRKQVVETRLQKFYSSVNQAVKMAELDHGDKSGWEYPDTDVDSTHDWYKKYLKKYLVTSKVEYVANGYTLVYFNDGSLLWMSPVAWHFYPQASFYNKNKGNFDLITDAYGKQDFIFYFNAARNEDNYKYHYKNAVEQYKVSWDGKKDTLYNSSSFGCKEVSPPNGRAYCTAVIQLNGWKIPDDYPLKL